MEENAAEKHGGQRGGTGGVTTTASNIWPDRLKMPSSCARLDSRGPLSLHGALAGELYYFSFCPAAIVIGIAIASANKGAVAAVG
jgi:hypothetical protein